MIALRSLVLALAIAAGILPAAAIEFSVCWGRDGRSEPTLVAGRCTTTRCLPEACCGRPDCRMASGPADRADASESPCDCCLVVSLGTPEAPSTARPTGTAPADLPSSEGMAVRALPDAPESAVAVPANRPLGPPASRRTHLRI